MGEMKSFSDLSNVVVKRGLCTGCGTCVGVCPHQSLVMNYVDGEPEPELRGECNGCGICYNTCPGADVDIPKLEHFIFGKNRQNTKIDIGVVEASMKGFATEEKIRKAGASGGIISSLLIYGLEKGIIDCALVAGFSEREPWRTEAKFARNAAEVIKAARSKLAVVPVNSLLTKAVSVGFSKIAVVGLPCHIHGIRKVQYLETPARVAKSIKLSLGLFCAAEYYYEGTRHIIHELGKVRDFKKIKSIDYRGGDWPTYFVITLKDGKKIFLDRHFCSGHMLTGAFKRDRCQVCTDWSNELADVVGGDYWGSLNKGQNERGMSMCLVRSHAGIKIVQNAISDGTLIMESLDSSEIIANFGYEMKMHGAAFRLMQRKRFGIPTPNFHRTISYDPIIRRFYISPSTNGKST